jgi:hypothetical protein
MLLFTKEQEDFINSAIQKAVLPLQQSLKILELENLELKKKINEQKDAHDQFQSKPLYSSLFSKDSNGSSSSTQHLAEPVIDLINAVNNENNEILKKEKNLIIFGLEGKGVDDSTQISKLFDEIGADKNEIVKHFRFKSITTNKPAPLCVILKNKIARNKILFKAKNLRSSPNFVNVFINSDQTKAQRIVFNRLKEEKNKLNSQNQNKEVYFVIRDGKVLKIRNQKNIDIKDEAISDANH